MKTEEMMNKKFNRLTVVGIAPSNKHGDIMLNCICECGVKTTIKKYSLLNNSCKSCGCLHREVMQKMKTTHNMTETRIYNIWSLMKSRCDNPKCKEYKYYGERGITYDKKWARFEGFFEDMKETYDDKLTIERVNNNKGYNKNNCKWATMLEQANNSRSNHCLTYMGEKKTISQWARKIGIAQTTLVQRINVHGWTTEQALTLPLYTRVKGE